MIMSYWRGYGVDVVEKGEHLIRFREKEREMNKGGGGNGMVLRRRKRLWETEQTFEAIAWFQAF